MINLDFISDKTQSVEKNTRCGVLIGSQKKFRYARAVALFDLQ